MTALPPVITNSVDDPKNSNRNTITSMNVVPRHQLGLLVVLLPCLSLWLILLQADTAMAAAEDRCPGSTENKTVSLEVIEAFILNRHGSDWVAQAQEYSATAALQSQEETSTNTNTHDFGQNCENGGETAAVGEIVCTVSGAADSESFQEDCTEETDGYYVTYNVTILCSNVDGAGQDDNVDSVTYNYLHQNLCIPPICSEEQVENELNQAADYYAGTFAEALEGSNCVVDSLAITSGAAVGKTVMALMLTAGLSSAIFAVMTSLL